MALKYLNTVGSDFTTDSIPAESPTHNVSINRERETQNTNMPGQSWCITYNEDSNTDWEPYWLVYKEVSSRRLAADESEFFIRQHASSRPAGLLVSELPRSETTTM